MSGPKRKVNKSYHCPVCKKNHSIKFAPDFAANRSQYPFSYVYLHPYTGEYEDIGETGRVVLTTLFIDAHLEIRGVEAFLQEENIEVISKDESKGIVNKLISHISQLQEDFDMLLNAYENLLHQYEQSLKDN